MKGQSVDWDQSLVKTKLRDVLMIYSADDLTWDLAHHTSKHNNQKISLVPDDQTGEALNKLPSATLGIHFSLTAEMLVSCQITSTVIFTFLLQ